MTSEQENFLRRRKRAWRDLFLILLFIFIIIVFLVYWFFYFKGSPREEYQSEIKPEAQLTLKTPNSEQGKIVTHFFSKISSQSLEFYYPPDKWQKDADDPFICL